MALVNPDIEGLQLPDGPEQEFCVHPAVRLWPNLGEGLADQPRAFPVGLFSRDLGDRREVL